LRTLLESVVAAPGARIAELNMLTVRERQEILVDWNGKTGPYPDTATIHQLIEDRVTTDPDNVALTHGNEQWTYTQLNNRANQLAHHLRNTGITPDTHNPVSHDPTPHPIPHTRRCTPYEARVGVDDSTLGLGRFTFSVRADGIRLWSSGTVKAGESAVPVQVDLTGRRTVQLVVEPHSTFDTLLPADWADSKFRCS
ncbi:NPCBM/NEW2 domain-containing protein, partial [Streptomyces sp. NPDC059374]|uniref:NPCBM/NEW2 domain-containing protein n=1 Tax=Streptomyces sp. NPDC059374 TaxID=3346814 RepID=UPI00368E4AD7